MVKSAYSPIKHLAHALFGKYSPRQALMAMITAYFDASESQQGTRVMTIGGCVSTVSKWEKFEIEWNAVLKKYDVPYLHMKEFNGCTGVFSQWKDRKDRDELKKNLLTELIAVAKKRINKGFSSSVRCIDFEEVNRDFMLREKWGSEYSLIGMAVVASVVKWKEKHFPMAPIQYLFEDGDAGQEDLRLRLSLQNVPYAFPPKKQEQNGVIRYITQFQLADFIAWENQALYSRLHNGEYGNSDPRTLLPNLRKSFQALYRQLPIVPKKFTNTSLRNLGRYYNLRRAAFSPAAAVDSRQSLI
jgi:hypothetical protein